MQVKVLSPVGLGLLGLAPNVDTGLESRTSEMSPSVSRSFSPSILNRHS